ncbi:MAG: hypothetical protein QE264_01320 [Flavobacterium sp.]|jgi:hypothetical protein|nr:hypothetical protein [Flavobacterium sp.]
MKSLKQLFDFYLDSSIHVALSCFALVNCTYLILNISINYSVALFAFFGTIAGYNFVKFDALARSKKNKMNWKLKAIAGLSFLSLLIGIYYFLALQNITKIIAGLVLLLTILYTLPFFPNKKNARNWAGFKIYIVAICWVAVTLILPILNSDYKIQSEIAILILQRLLLIFSLILIFEIKDLKNDDPHLKTVPQQIGVKNTKTLGFILLVIFSGLGFFNSNFQFLELQLNFFIAIVIGVFLFFSTENRSRYYTDFWVESIPIVWWLLFLFIQ